MGGLSADPLSWRVCGFGDKILKDKVTSTLCASAPNVLYSLTRYFSRSGQIGEKKEAEKENEGRDRDD